MRRACMVCVFAILSLPAATDPSPGAEAVLQLGVRGTAGGGVPALHRDSVDTYESKAGGGAAIDVSFGSFPWITATIDVSYDRALITARDPKTYVEFLRPEAGVRLRAPLTDWFAPYLSASAGYGFGWVSRVPIEGASPAASGFTLRAGPGLEFRVGRTSLFVEAFLDSFPGLYTGLSVRVGAGWTFDPSRRLVEARRLYELEQRPERLHESPAMSAADAGVDFVGFEIEPVFPILYKYYDAHPIGALLIANPNPVPLTDVRVRLDMATYIDSPKLSAAIPELEPGGEQRVELFALFNDRVLYMTEGDKVAATVTVEFRVDGVRGSDQETVTIDFYDRNALRWDDDRKVASFVTARDVEVQRWAKALAALVRREANTGVSDRFQTGMMAFTAMAESGLTYVVDPNSPYEHLSQNPLAIDYVQFPRQTFDFRAGDCDDLSVCLAALLEATGVPTAFVTVPGHILVAFMLEWNAAQVRHRFAAADQLIFRPDGSVWVPVETTMLRRGFLEAWAAGARQWREHEARGTADFIVTSDAWAVYPPVAFVDDTTFSTPPDSVIFEAFRTQLSRFVGQEISGRESTLLARIESSPDDVRSRNNLGALYATYGLYDRAREQFEHAVRVTEHAPALANLGNLAFLENDLEAAVRFYERALAVRSDYDLAFLGAARAHHGLENYGSAGRHYEALRRANPELAGQFTHLELRDAHAARAADAAQVTWFVFWGQEP